MFQGPMDPGVVLEQLFPGAVEQIGKRQLLCSFLHTRETNVTGQCDYLVSPPNMRRKRRWSHMVFSVTSWAGL